MKPARKQRCAQGLFVCSCLPPPLAKFAIELVVNAIHFLLMIFCLLHDAAAVGAPVNVLILVFVRFAHLSFPKIPSEQIRAVRQNQRIIGGDACDPPIAWDVCRQPVLVEAPA
jgi:hypothetical protein